MVIPLRDNNPTERIPYLVVLLIAANIALFAFWQPHGGGRTENQFTYAHAAIPCELKQGSPLTYGEAIANLCESRAAIDLVTPPGASTTEIDAHKNIWLAALFSMFMHGSWLHLLGNMLFLWVFGNNLEDRLGIFGFTAFYLFVGLAALAGHVIADPSSTVPVVGASGAIAGVMGAYLVLWPHARVLTIIPPVIVLPLPASFVLLFWFGLQFLTDPNSSVAWVAHVTGFVAGVLIAAALRPRYRRPPPALPPPQYGWR